MLIPIFKVFLRKLLVHQTTRQIKIFRTDTTANAVIQHDTAQIINIRIVLRAVCNAWYSIFVSYVLTQRKICRDARHEERKLALSPNLEFSRRESGVQVKPLHSKFIPALSTFLPQTVSQKSLCIDLQRLNWVVGHFSWIRLLRKQQQRQPASESTT